jgi:signal transduction histidine kinase
LSLAIVVGLSLFMFYERAQTSAFYRQRDQMKALESAQESLRRSRENLRTLAVRQQELVEDERKRMSQEIHDELGQRLSLLRLELAMLSTRVGPSQTGSELARIKEEIDELIQVVRDVAHRLRPGSLEAGLLLAMDALVHDFSRVTGIKVAVKSLLPPGLEISVPIRTACFRIAQEALTNIARHAQARSVDISLSAPNGSLLMRIKDDGLGFDPEKRSPASMGITGML